MEKYQAIGCDIDMRHGSIVLVDWEEPTPQSVVIKDINIIHEYSQGIYHSKSEIKDTIYAGEQMMKNLWVWIDENGQAFPDSYPEIVGIEYDINRVNYMNARKLSAIQHAHFIAVFMYLLLEDEEFGFNVKIVHPMTLRSYRGKEKIRELVDLTDVGSRQNPLKFYLSLNLEDSEGNWKTSLDEFGDIADAILVAIISSRKERNIK